MNENTGKNTSWTLPHKTSEPKVSGSTPDGCNARKPSGNTGLFSLCAHWWFSGVPPRLTATSVSSTSFLSAQQLIQHRPRHRPVRPAEDGNRSSPTSRSPDALRNAECRPSSAPKSSGTSQATRKRSEISAYITGCLAPFRSKSVTSSPRCAGNGYRSRSQRPAHCDRTPSRLLQRYPPVCHYVRRLQTLRTTQGRRGQLFKGMGDSDGDAGVETRSRDLCNSPMAITPVSALVVSATVKTTQSAVKAVTGSTASDNSLAAPTIVHPRPTSVPSTTRPQGRIR